MSGTHHLMTITNVALGDMGACRNAKTKSLRAWEPGSLELEGNKWVSLIVRRRLQDGFDDVRFFHSG